MEFFLGSVPEDTENNGAKGTTQGCYNPYRQSSCCQSQFRRSHYLQPVGVYEQTWKDYNSRYSITRSALLLCEVALEGKKPLMVIGKDAT